ncbi:uncharacterized protein DDB_G0271670-like [Homarus americanus]|nr:uncharacterized protein DDB_G0271670-like [Homarus americanus]
MLYFFHHYELPAILQQAQIQQLGRVHTVNIVLRNVPNNNNNNNNNNQNAANNTANNTGVGDTGGERESANNGTSGTRNDGVPRPNIPPMVNLVFRNMTGGLANNRNGNTSLSFVFRNVRNIVQNLQQNNTASTSTSTSTTTTTTSAFNTATVTVSTTSTTTTTFMGTFATGSNTTNPTTSIASTATVSTPQVSGVGPLDSNSSSNSFSLSSFPTSSISSLASPATFSSHMTPVSPPRQPDITATSSNASETVSNNALGSVVSDRTDSEPFMLTSDSLGSSRDSLPLGALPSSPHETSIPVKDLPSSSDSVSLDDGEHNDGMRYKAIPVGAHMHKSFNHCIYDGSGKCSSDSKVAEDTASVFSGTSEVIKGDTNSLLRNVGDMPYGTARALDHPVTQNVELTNADCQAVKVCKSSDVAVEPLQPEQELRHRITSENHRHHRPHLDSESSG